MNLDTQETNKFGSLSSKWWDPQGPLKTLHTVNPTRLAFIKTHAALAGKQILDLGCGGGILTEALAREGGHVVGLDASPEVIEIAKLHALDSELTIQYESCLAEDFVRQHPAHFDVITCMEMLEHVPEPEVIIQNCYSLQKPGGHLFLSTLNRNLKTFALAIVAAEYLLNLIPRGTHTYDKCIQPSELHRWCEAAGYTVKAICGLQYNPFTAAARLTQKPDINYIVYAQKD